MWTIWSCNTIVKANYLFLFLYSSLLSVQPGCFSAPTLQWGQSCFVAHRLGTDRQLEALDLRQELCSKWTIIWNSIHQQWYHFIHLPRRWSTLWTAADLHFQPVRWNRQIFMSWFEIVVVSFHQSMCISTGNLSCLEESIFFRLHRSFHGCSPRNE